jgi:hypothetical protein
VPARGTAHTAHACAELGVGNADQLGRHERALVELAARRIVLEIRAPERDRQDARLGVEVRAHARHDQRAFDDQIVRGAIVGNATYEMES